MKSTTQAPAQGQINWRDHLPVHPAAEFFPLMSQAELRGMADDIKKNDLREPIVICTPLSRNDFLETRSRRRESLERKKKREANRQTWKLLDGRNRLDALALVEKLTVEEGELCLNYAPIKEPMAQWCGERHVVAHYDVDDETAHALVASYNLHRRHLTAEQKREVIANFLKARPELSNRQIAKQIQDTGIKTDDKAVIRVRRKLESTAALPELEKTVGADGKARKQRKEPKAETVKVRLAGETLKSIDGFSDAAKQQIAAAVEADEQVDTPQDFWQRSLGNLAGDVISLRAYWTREFGEWEKFDAPSDLVTLAEQAAQAWSELAADLRSRNKRRDAA